MIHPKPWHRQGSRLFSKRGYIGEIGRPEDAQFIVDTVNQGVGATLPEELAEMLRDLAAAKRFNDKKSEDIPKTGRPIRPNGVLATTQKLVDYAEKHLMVAIISRA